MILEQKIGFDRVRRQIAERCSTQYAVDKVWDEEISRDAKEIDLRLQLTDEMRLISMFEDSFPSVGFIDTKPFLLPLNVPSTYIDLVSLSKLRISLDTLRKILSFFKGCKDDLYPNLRKLSEQITYYPEVSRRIDSLLDKSGEMRDNASEQLQTIRRSLKEKEGAISKRISQLLKKAQTEGIVDEDASVSVRDGKILIPVPAANKKRIAGFVYDESASGKTAFVEPMEVVELNNQVRQLKFEEQREILKILVEFTDFLRPYLEELIAASEYIGEIDFIRAKANVALDMIAGMPIISQTGELALRKARHPLLEKALKKEKKDIVPLTLTLTREKHILLISGPNAGGKSVCLKTVGLLQYMFQWGMLIPTSEISEMVIFDNIFIDIGDDQSLDNDLSTYSSHLVNVRKILENATDNSLVLIDEFGSGTEPTAGGAIAEAVLARLEEIGAYGVITTHYTNLKLYANNSSGVVNGAMLFDVAGITPLFKLEQGLPGNSFAFELARNIGLPETIVKDAEERAGSGFVSIERNLRQIARSKRVLDEKLARIRSTDKTLESLTDKYHKELGDIKQLRKEIIDEARAEAKEIIDRSNRKVEQTIREIKEAQAEREKTRAIRKDLEQFRQEMENEAESELEQQITRKMEQIVARKEREKERKERRKSEAQRQEEARVRAAASKERIVADKPLEVGDKVRIKGSEIVGEITQMSDKTIAVAVGNIISKMAPYKVERISNQEYKDSTRYAKPQSIITSSSISERRLNFKPKIDIRGERLDSALDIVTRFIDDALMVGLSEVKILHGKGNGVLREEIRKYLKTMPGVNSLRDEALQLGGAGVTVVTLD
ncbi:MAG: endonuclease MutS2 [Bacteroidales bacterium]|jgi:DNA mismatch repair protein MutS2|nr:endonuclease MutS2 [Bacteroidales bacterium]NLX41815.1 endonuclease MutS2 [Bacteroidales bacterium]